MWSNNVYTLVNSHYIVLNSSVLDANLEFGDMRIVSHTPRYDLLDSFWS